MRVSVEAQGSLTDLLTTSQEMGTCGAARVGLVKARCSSVTGFGREIRRPEKSQLFHWLLLRGVSRRLRLQPVQLLHVAALQRCTGELSAQFDGSDVLASDQREDQCRGENAASSSGVFLSTETPSQSCTILLSHPKLSSAQTNEVTQSQRTLPDPPRLSWVQVRPPAATLATWCA